MPHISSRLRAIKCGWVHKLRMKSGIFWLAFIDTPLHDADDAVFQTPLPLGDDHQEYASECVHAWQETLHLLDIDLGGLIWPMFNHHQQPLPKKKISCVTIAEAVSNDWSCMNYLEQACISAETKRILANLEQD